MSLLEEKYTVIGWHNEEHFMTAKQLLKRVQEDSTSDYNWIASATELVRICTQPSFPQSYAHAIKIAILNCFANLELKRERSGYSEDTDNEAISFCYHTLSGVSEEADTAKQNYLKAIIEGVTRSHFRLFEFDHYGPTYRKLCNDWKDSMLKEYSPLSFLFFATLRQTLHEDFDKFMKKAEGEGCFKEDDKANQEKEKKLWSNLLSSLP